MNFLQVLNPFMQSTPFPMEYVPWYVYTLEILLYPFIVVSNIAHLWFRYYFMGATWHWDVSISEAWGICLCTCELVAAPIILWLYKMAWKWFKRIVFGIK